ncbi:MAG: right-handed parallel beta-helix repeat-containing protein [Methanobacteriota archaeon]
MRFNPAATTLALAVMMLTASLHALPAAGKVEGGETPNDIEYVPGDWYVASSEWRNDTTVILRGNLIVPTGATLAFRNVTLKMDCTLSDGQYRVEVRPGGRFYANDTDGDPSTAGDAPVIANNGTIYGFALQVNESGVFELRNGALTKCGLLHGQVGAGVSGPRLLSDNAALVGSEIYGCANGVVVDSANATITGCTIRNNLFNGVYVTNLSVPSHRFSFDVNNSNISGNAGAGVDVNVDYLDAHLADNELWSNGKGGVLLKGAMFCNATLSRNILGKNFEPGTIGFFASPGGSVDASMDNNTLVANNGTQVRAGIENTGSSYLDEISARSVELDAIDNVIDSDGAFAGFFALATERIRTNLSRNEIHTDGSSYGAIHVGKLAYGKVNNQAATGSVSVELVGNNISNKDGGALKITALRRLWVNMTDNNLTNLVSLCGGMSFGWLSDSIDDSTPDTADILVLNNRFKDVEGSNGLWMKAVYDLNATVENNTFKNILGGALRLGWLSDVDSNYAPLPWAYPTRNVRAKVCNNVISGGSGPGIWIYSSNGSQVFSNTVSWKYGNYYPYMGDGIRIQSTNKPTFVHHNTIVDCSMVGIRLFNATGASVYDNTLSSNIYGLGFESQARGNTLWRNVVTKTTSEYGYYLTVDSLNNSIPVNNTVQGSYLKLIHGLHGTPIVLATFPPWNEQVHLMSNLGQIIVGDSTYLDIQGHVAKNGSAGLCLSNVTHSLVRGNALSSNQALGGSGLDLRTGSAWNVVRGNTLSSNTRGISFNTMAAENTLWSNTVTKAASQTGLWFDTQSRWLRNIIPANNTVNGVSMRYYHSVSGFSLDGASVNVPLMTNLGQVTAVNCTGLSLSNITLIGASGASGIYLHATDGVTILDSSVSGSYMGLYARDSDGLLLRDVSLNQGTYNCDLYNVANVVIEGCNLDNGATLLYLRSTSPTIRNSSINGASYLAFNLSSGSKAKLLNTTLQRNSATVSADSSLEVSWYLHTLVQCNNMVVGFAALRLTNVTGATVLNALTDGSGRMRNVAVPEFKLDGAAGLKMYNPYNLNVTKAGYGSADVFAPMDSTTALVVILDDRTSPVTTVGPSLDRSPVLASRGKVWLNATFDDRVTGNGTISRGEYVISATATPNGGGTGMTAADGALDSACETLTAPISIAGWVEGSYTIWTHAADAAGNWCPWQQAQLTVNDDLGPKLTKGPTVSPTAVSTETSRLWVNATFDDSLTGGSDMAGCSLTVSNGSGVIGPALYPYTITATDGAFDEAAEGLSVSIDCTLWGVGIYTLSIMGKDERGNLGNVIALTLNVADKTPPSIPTDFRVSTGNGTLKLSWTAGTEADLAGYRLYRSYVSGKSYSLIANVPGNDITYLDVGLVNGVTYYYVLTAVDNATDPNESPRSIEVSGKPMAEAVIDDGGDGSTDDGGSGDDGGTDDGDSDDGGSTDDGGSDDGVDTDDGGGSADDDSDANKTASGSDLDSGLLGAAVAAVILSIVAASAIYRKKSLRKRGK